MRSLAAPVPATLAFVLAACGGSGSKPAVKPTPSPSSPAPAPAAKARDLRAECVEIFAIFGKIGGSAVAPSEADLQKCREEQLSRAQVQCFRDATSMADIAFCTPTRKKLEKKDFGDMDDERDIEARTLLSELAMAARLYQVDNGAFAKGDTGLTPGPPLCEDDHSKRHQPSPEDFAGPLWTALEFKISFPYAFSYRYLSDGKSFTITAQGDADCNDRYATYVIKGSISSGGQFQRSEIELDDPGE